MIPGTAKASDTRESPSRDLAGLQTGIEIQSPPSLRPPVSYVFVESSLCSVEDSQTAISCGPSSPIGTQPTVTDASSSSGKPPAQVETFRLQPRGTILNYSYSSPVSPRHGQIESKRGRKRHANCLRDGSHGGMEKTGAELPAKKSLSPKERVFASSLDSPLPNLGGLCIRSPLHTNPPSYPGVSEDCHKSLNSSFSRYSNSPGISFNNGSTPRKEEWKPDDSMWSPAMTASSANSSRVMPLKVLIHNDPSTPSSTRPPLPTTLTVGRPQESEGNAVSVQVAPANSPQSSLGTAPASESIISQVRNRKNPPQTDHSEPRSTPRRSPRIPKISLTPRSDRTPFSQSDVSPLFPILDTSIPTDEGIAAPPESQALLRQAYDRHMTSGTTDGTERETLENPLSLDSFIPLPGFEVQGTSLLHEHEPLQEFGFPDDASLSEEELDAEGFFLASPAKIIEEKTAGAVTKQARLRRTLDSTGDLSTTSLLGTQYLPWSSGAGTTEGMCRVEASAAHRPFNQEEEHRSVCETDIPLVLNIQAPPFQEPHHDMVTPPTYPQPDKPPLLST